MFKFLVEILICPECHGELTWDITDMSDTCITEAQVKCNACGKAYFIKDGIACFVEYESGVDDNWQRIEGFIKGLMSESPYVIEQLMSVAPEEMNAADIMIRSMICEVEGDYAEAARLYALMREKAYSEESLKAAQSQADYIVDALKNEKGFILDVASGKGALVKELLARTSAPVVSSDISFYVLKHAKEIDRLNGFGDRISYMAFDLNKTPFRNGSVNVMTSFFGMANIQHPEKIFKEIRRVCGGKLYSACFFCCEDNIVNLKALENFGYDKTTIKSKYIENMDAAGLCSVVENSVIVLDEPTPVGEIVQGMKIDGFPIATGNFERAVVISD